MTKRFQPRVDTCQLRRVWLPGIRQRRLFSTRQIQDAVPEAAEEVIRTCVFPKPLRRCPREHGRGGRRNGDWVLAIMQTPFQGTIETFRQELKNRGTFPPTARE